MKYNSFFIRLYRLLNFKLIVLLRYLPSSYSVDYLPAHDNVLVEVNPLKISRRVESKDWSLVRRKWFFFKDDIETIFKTISPDEYHQTIKELWMEGKSYKDTTQYASMIKAVDLYQKGQISNPSRIGAYWCRSRSDVDRYFELLHNCYEGIKKEGYLPQYILLKKSNKNSANIISNVNDEIRILVDSSGNLVFSGNSANHRFSIVRFLKIESVPAILVGVSRTWLTQQVDIKGVGYSHLIKEIILKHKDMKEYVPESNND